MADRNNRPATRTQKPPSPRPQVESIDDKVDEAVYESFPASDPPSHTGTQARPASNDAAAEARIREEMKRDKH